MNSERAPKSFNEAVAQRFADQGLIQPEEITQEILENNTKFREFCLKVRNNIENAGADFLIKFQKQPQNFDGCIEGFYQEEELDQKFPLAKDIRLRIGDDCRYIFRAEPAGFYLNIVERADGRRQVIRVVDTDRSESQVCIDAAIAPPILPKFEAFRLENGQTALLIDWIDGRKPNTKEEKQKCLTESIWLLVIPLEKYDFWANNFVIQKGTDEAYYIDRDTIETIAEQGYVVPDDERIAIFEENKEKMKI